MIFVRKPGCVRAICALSFTPSRLCDPIRASRVVPISPELFYALTLFVVSPARHLSHHSLPPLSCFVHILFSYPFRYIIYAGCRCRFRRIVFHVAVII